MSGLNHLPAKKAYFNGTEGSNPSISAKIKLTYGVMVALQVLVLSAQVRILVSQLNNQKRESIFLRFAFFILSLPLS